MRGWRWAILLVVTSCGKAEKGDVADRDAFIEQLCAELMSCCVEAGRSTDGAKCRGVYQIITPESGFDQEALDACVEAARHRETQCSQDFEDLPHCRVVFDAGGTLRLGEACDDDRQCAPMLEGPVRCLGIITDGAPVARRCQVEVPGVAGSAPCTGFVADRYAAYFGGVREGEPTTSYICYERDGLWCDQLTRQCEPLVGPGEACGDGTQWCEATAFCPIERVCREPLDLGEACRMTDECVATAYCDEYTSTCLPLRAAGDICADDIECQSRSCRDVRCEPPGARTVRFFCGEE